MLDIANVTVIDAVGAMNGTARVATYAVCFAAQKELVHELHLSPPHILIVTIVLMRLAFLAAREHAEHGTQLPGLRRTLALVATLCVVGHAIQWYILIDWGCMVALGPSPIIPIVFYLRLPLGMLILVLMCHQKATYQTRFWITLLYIVVSPFASTYVAMVVAFIVDVLWMILCHVSHAANVYYYAGYVVCILAIGAGIHAAIKRGETVPATYDADRQTEQNKKDAHV